ncbi:uncharacterized protein PITG_10182 [Phytophthora infestans T30-4]|uniref:Uncharacterized protein n=1 Tax=Phytophthora infestans (strain T30-4) TaxID=403677 RepID=D0NEI8_PHYIT|nr:uncharacterized protein PITG_10182 [Phytophthora infestans T30-4]EEY56633.1 hypothetical protein PITG_10182 [Phytophthora infestans T30-4]|eukprot:XP_002902707.1 hypothetical protein PITG_10182 [Phytophthora infestans T30-4]
MSSMPWSLAQTSLSGAGARRQREFDQTVLAHRHVNGAFRHIPTAAADYASRLMLEPGTDACNEKKFTPWFTADKVLGLE